MVDSGNRGEARLSPAPRPASAPSRRPPGDLRSRSAGGELPRQGRRREGVGKAQGRFRRAPPASPGHFPLSPARSRARPRTTPGPRRRASSRLSNGPVKHEPEGAPEPPGGSAGRASDGPGVRHGTGGGRAPPSGSSRRPVLRPRLPPAGRVPRIGEREDDRRRLPPPRSRFRPRRATGRRWRRSRLSNDSRSSPKAGATAGLRRRMAASGPRTGPGRSPLRSRGPAIPPPVGRRAAAAGPAVVPTIGGRPPRARTGKPGPPRRSADRTAPLSLLPGSRPALGRMMGSLAPGR